MQCKTGYTHMELMIIIAILSIFGLIFLLFSQPPHSKQAANDSTHVLTAGIDRDHPASKYRLPAVSL